MTERAHHLLDEGPIRVLHVDDDACFLKTAKAILEMQGAFQVDTASGVEEAWEKMKKEKYDAVISDYQMPGKDGLQFLKELRVKGNSIPFVVFTGKGREEVAVKALNLGADGYFNKSGHPETVYGELAHGIRQVVDKRRAEQSFLKSEDKYRRLVETLREGIWAIDKDSCTTYANPRMAEMLGYSIEEMKGRHLFSFMDERGVEIAKRLLERRRQGIKEQHDFEFLKKDGTRIYVTLETTPITDDNGNYSGALASVMDTTERKQAEKERQIQREELTMILDYLPLQIWYKDKNNRLLRVNKRFAEHMGVSKRDLEGKSLSDLFPPDIARKCWEEDKEVIETDQSKIDILDHHESAQGLRFFLTSKVPCKDTDGKAIGTINFSIDITERRKADEEIRSLANFSSENPNPVLRVARDGTVLFANAAAKRILEKDGSGVGELAAVRGRQWVSDVLKSGLPREAEFKLEDKVFSVMFAPILDGGYVNIYGIDITARKKAEENLKESEERYRQLIEFAPDPIFTYDLNGRLLDCNRQAEKLSGFKKEELLGKDIFTSARGRSLIKIVPGQRTEPAEYELVSKDGSKLDVEISTFPVNRKGKVEIIAIGRDITERKKAEEALQESEERFRTVIENAPFGYYRVGKDGMWQYVNSMWERMHGLSLEEVVGKPFEITQTGEDVEQAKENVRRALAGETIVGEFSRLTHDGDVGYHSFNIQPVKRDNEIVAIEGFINDITERKKAETELHSERKRLLEVLETLPEMVCLLTPDYHVVFANRSFRNKFGEAKGRHCYDYCIGKSKPCDFCEAYEVLKTGKPHHWELTIPDGSIIDVLDFPFTDADGKPMILELDFDITERKKAEKSLNGAVKQLAMANEKLGVVGKLSRHDVRNKLSAVVGNSYLAKKALPNDHKALDYLRNIESACIEATRVLGFAATYESLGIEELTLVEVDKAVEEAVSLFSELKGVEVVNNCQGLTVMADSALTQLFLNLIENSLKHGKNVGQIKIYHEEGKDTLKLFYEDNGVGIPEANKPRLFDVGFTTGNGSGLGLPLIKRMMEIFGWAIEEEGEPGKGAKFVITIPKTNIKMSAHNT